ncbi:hypothetical protein BD560DRAFT_402588 [Blakeslea trispora]|nr:hypothetical protein BD560DRAFT_402588 [Blakeslea trispora]
MSYPNPYQPPQGQNGPTRIQQQVYNNNYLHEQASYRSSENTNNASNSSPSNSSSLPAPVDHYPTSYDSRKLYTCHEPGCSEFFDHSNALRMHQRNIHGRDNDDSSRSSQGRPYVCPYAECGKSFTQYGNLKTHSRKHTGERPYHCTYDGCDKSFTQLGNLKTHEKIHWPVKPFTCVYPNCGKGFTQRGNLKTHQVKVHQMMPQ